MGSRRYPGRRSTQGLAADCRRRGGRGDGPGRLRQRRQQQQQQQHQQQHGCGQRHVVGHRHRPRRARSSWSASPITSTGANDARTVLINAFEKQYPNIKVTLISAPTNTDTNRATLATQISGGSATPDVFMGDVIWPAQFGAHQLAVPLSDYLPPSYWSQFAPGLVEGATLQGQGLRLAAVRGPGLPVLPQGPAGQGAPAGCRTTWEQLRDRRREAAEGRAGQVRLRLAGRLV